MQLKDIKNLFLKFKETGLSGRYITNAHIAPKLDQIAKYAHVETIGKSVLKKPVYGLKIGNGDKKILMWSQMHGNESTTTKAIFDLLNTLISNNTLITHILEACTIYIIPILNPDGADAYTRVNANTVDLNRDAQDLTQPESKILKSVFETFKPNFCYNLHGQRTIFSAGKTNKSATVSFLAPAQDQACSVTANRKVAMEVIHAMNTALQQVIPNQVGVYDDAFNINCVGDTFQAKNVPTILFEAGHYQKDYEREVTRELIYVSYLESLDYISRTKVTGGNYKGYLNIPENEKCLLDVIIRNVKIDGKIQDVGVQYQERLEGKKVKFIPKVVKINKLNALFGHKEIDGKGGELFGEDGNTLKLDYENVFVILNNEKILL